MTDVLVKGGYLKTEMTYIEDDVKTLGGRWTSTSNVERPGTDLSFIALRKNLILDFWHLDVCDRFLLCKQPFV